jgi:hypothetical protein
MRSGVAGLFVAFMVAVPAWAVGLPDTGQDLCANGSHVLVACTQASAGDAAIYPRQDGRFGFDAKVTHGSAVKTGAGAAGFDYTKIANNATNVPANTALGSAPTDWACTRDNITGLMWEVKTAGVADLRYSSRTYSWFSSAGATNGGNPGTPDTGAGNGNDNCADPSRCDTEKFILDVNAVGLCTHNDWRLPSRRELHTLVHYGTNPRIDPTYFSNVAIVGPLWTDSTNAADTASAWAFDLSSTLGSPSSYAKTFSLPTMLVRGPRF